MSISDEIMIETRHLRKEYPIEGDAVVALDDINLKIRKGEICCIFGQSGSGKSTLLNQLAGLEKPTKGGVRLGDTIISRLDESELAQFRQHEIGFVFQSYNLIPSLTAIENTAMPLMFQGMPRQERMARAASILKLVGLEDRMKHYPRQMSGGQQQRVGIARAFVNMPRIVFADEPTGNLDSRSTKEIMEMITRFSRRFHQTIVIVSHDPETAAYADHIVTLFDGRIIREEYQTPDLISVQAEHAVHASASSEDRHGAEHTDRKEKRVKKERGESA